jgi:hypothetical protein
MTLFAHYSEAYEVKTCSRSVQGEIIGQIHVHGWENDRFRLVLDQFKGSRISIVCFRITSKHEIRVIHLFHTLLRNHALSTQYVCL